MKIGVPVGGFHQGNTSEYVVRALTQLGHQSVVLDQSEFEAAASANRFELYFCVDSGEPLKFSTLPRETLARTAFWAIDYRHNKNRVTRSPTDETNARALAESGGWIFQAQFQDCEDCARNGIERTSWLPMAADPEIWSPSSATEKKFDVSFVGNIWDEGRLRAIQLIQLATLGPNGLGPNALRCGLFCNGKLWKEQAAAAIGSSEIGFNISSWYGTEHAYDLNMRFFETLSCGVPIVTNAVPAIERLFPEPPTFVRQYSNEREIVPTLSSALADSAFLASGSAARKWVLDTGTYRHRMVDALMTVKAKCHVG